MTRYKEYLNKMLEENKEIVSEFKDIHDKYQLDEDKWQEKLNYVGAKFMDIVREYENRLCSNTERGMYIKYSSGLSEKFHSEIKKVFPYFDHIGLKPQLKKQDDIFSIKKISL